MTVNPITHEIQKFKNLNIRKFENLTIWKLKITTVIYHDES